MMIRVQWRLQLVLVIATSAPNAFAFFLPEGSPEQAIVEILTATKPEAVEKHFPESVRDGLRSLGAEDRQACGQRLLIGKGLMAGGDLQVPEDGHALLVQSAAGSEESSELRLEREVIGGGDALLKLAIVGAGKEHGEILVWMRLELGDWRVTEFQWLNSGNQVTIDDPAFVEQFRRPMQKANESKAIGVLQNLRYALETYVERYPEVGLPADLTALGYASDAATQFSNDIVNMSDDGETFDSGDLRDAQHAGLLDNATAANRFESDGYTFHYELRVGALMAGTSLPPGPRNTEGSPYAASTWTIPARSTAPARTAMPRRKTMQRIDRLAA